jgi:hypothetical protein
MHQRNIHIAGVNGNTFIACAKKGMHPVKPSIAPQPLPGERLLQGIVVSKKYGQRVRCIRLPPTVAILRNCGDAPALIANESSGKCCFYISMLGHFGIGG